jgi:glutaredoxin
MRRLTLYTGRHCPLCDEALELLERLGPELGFTVDAIDIATDRELLRRYRHDIPVLALDGEVLLSAPLEDGEVRRVLARRLAGHGASGKDRPTC